MKKQLLTITTLALMAISSVAQTTLLSESFSGQALPTNWSNDSLGVTPFWSWAFNNPNNHVITGANFDTNFAILDSDFDGNGNNQDVSLVTAAVNTTGYTGVVLNFSEQFQSYPASYNRIDYSINGGTTWLNLRATDSVNIGFPNPAVSSSIALPANALNVTNLKIRFNYSASWGYWWAIDSVQVIGLNNCSGAPTAGTIMGAPSSVCPSVPYDLNLTGASMAVGVTYQWQSSTNGTTYTNISGATSMTYHDSITAAPIYYQVVVACAFGSSSTTSAVSVATVNAPSACYCIPQFSNMACGSAEVTDVSITGTTLSNLASTCTLTSGVPYTVYPASGSTTGTLNAGTAYDINVTTSAGAIVSLWIDYNQNGIFEDTEWKQVCTTSTAAVANTLNFTVPLTASLGQTGMRIRSRLAGNPNDSTYACLSMGSGECEDYFITIAAPTSIKAVNTSGFTFYPNPTNNNIQIRLAQTSKQSVIVVTDLLGNSVMDKVITQSGTLTLNVANLPAGIYLINLSNESGSTTQKLVVTK